MESTYRKTKNIAWALLGINLVLFVVYCLVTILMASIAFYKNNILKQINLVTNSQSMYDSIKSTIKTYSPTVHAPKLELYLFWALVGAIVYVAFWVILNIFADIRNDLLASSSGFSHPKSFKKSTYWTQIILRELLRLTALFGLIIYVIIWLKKIGPNLIVVFERFINSLVDLHSAVYLIYFVLGSFISLHVVTILVRLITQKFLSSGDKSFNEL